MGESYRALRAESAVEAAEKKIEILTNALEAYADRDGALWENCIDDGEQGLTRKYISGTGHPNLIARDALESAARVAPEKHDRKLPADLSPLNLRAYLSNVFATCGCSELDEMIKVIVGLLEWHRQSNKGANRIPYAAVFPGLVGVFYILAGILDHAGLAEHWDSIRGPYLTDDGERLLAALKQFTPDQIDDAEGTAYDGVYYP